MSESKFAWQPPPELNVTVDPTFGCWIWSGGLNSKGYPANMRTVWEEVMGISLPGPHVHLDHVCRRRACLNPRHLDPVTVSENQKRRLARYRRLELKQCPLGHKFVPETTLQTPEDGKVCRVCLEPKW